MFWRPWIRSFLYGFCSLLFAVNTPQAAFQPALVFNFLCNIGFLTGVHRLLKSFSQVHKRSITLSLVLNSSGDKIINQNEIGLFLECSSEVTHSRLSGHTVSSQLGGFLSGVTHIWFVSPFSGDPFTKKCQQGRELIETKNLMKQQLMWT